MPEKDKIKEPEGKIIATSMNFHVPKLQKAKLATELDAHPIDFTQTRKDFKSWFRKTFQFTYSINPKTEKKEISSITLSPGPDAIYDVPDGADLFLYLDAIPGGVSGEEFSVFLSLYQPVFKMLALEERARIFADNGPDEQERFADWESRSILLEIMHLKDARPINFSKEIERRMSELPQNVQEPEHIRQDKGVWGKRRPGIGMLFTNNIVAREYPEYDLPYLDELLCYHDSLLFQTLINNSKKIPKVWGLWVAAHSELLSDTTSETHKLFCAIFHIPEGKLFDDDGSIRQEVRLVIPPDLYDGLAMVQNRKQESIQAVLQSETNRQRTLQILSGQLQITCDSNFTLSCNNIPAEMDTITVAIKRNDKTYARTSFRPSEEASIDLKKCTFETFPSSPKNPTVSWEQISQWKGGDSYTIEVEGKIGAQGGNPQIIHTWKPEKTRREPAQINIATPVALARVGAKVSTRVHAATIPHAPRSYIVAPFLIAPKTQKSLKEAEKEDLQAALEMFLGKGDEELQNFFLDHHVWDEDAQTLTLAITIGDLEEMGYILKELSAEEYGPMLQWTAKLEERSWIMAEGTPDKIREIVPAIYGHLAQQAQEQKDMTRVKEIDAELGELGLQPSRRNTETLMAELRKTCRGKPINTARLTAKIKELGILDICFTTRPTANMLDILERRFRCFNNATSITLAERSGNTKQNKWTLTYNWETQEFSTQGLDDELYLERLKNALLNFINTCIEEKKRGLAGITEKTRNRRDLNELTKEFIGELKVGHARLLIETEDGVYKIISGIQSHDLLERIREEQKTYGIESVALLYRRNTYAFSGESDSRSKPSKTKSESDYQSFSLPGRIGILKERVLKTLFNGNSGVLERSAFIPGSPVYQVLKLHKAQFEEKNTRILEREDINDDFMQDFIQILQKNDILISYREFIALPTRDLNDVGVFGNSAFAAILNQIIQDINESDPK